ncbi:MAG: DNA-binding winged helix-turn-helix (wHTH) protein [Arenicella sp.]|jgi:DNA-binding winged helix-turn-helix (wHTH) protein
METIYTDDHFLNRRYSIGRFTIDPVAGIASWGSSFIYLRRKEVEVLGLLASRQGTIVPRKDFIESIWSNNFHSGNCALTDTVYSLRKALNDKNRRMPVLSTIPKKGYQLNVPVEGG